MPCLAYLARVREAYPAVTALGARLVAVGTGSEAQAGELGARGPPPPPPPAPPPAPPHAPPPPPPPPRHCRLLDQ